jgi:hypothetical protein
VPDAFLSDKPAEFDAWTIGVVTLVEADSVVIPVVAPVSLIVTTELSMILPDVPSNRAMALSVALAGPTTSPLVAGAAHVGAPPVVAVNIWPVVPAAVKA